MLHIKLPKNRVKFACIAMADFNRKRNEVLRLQYHHEVETWRKMMKATDYNAQLVIPTPPFFHPVKKYTDMAVAARASTGDVYVSAELWTEIRGAM